MRGRFTAAALSLLVLGAEGLRAEPLLLGPGDVVSLAVVGMAGLDRTATVDGEGLVRLPLVGPTEVAGLTIDAAAERVAARLAEAAGVPPETVLMEVAAHRPVYVIGAARGAGVVAFRPGLTVLQAAAEASAAPAGEDLRLIELLEAGRTETAVAARAARLAELRALRARLEAERDGAPLAGAGAAPEGVGPDRWAAILERQTRVLAERERFHAARVAQFDALERVFTARIASLDGEIAVQDERIAVFEADLGQIMSLGAVGLATQERISAVRARLLEAQLGRLRALSDRTEAEGERVLAVEGRQQAQVQRDLELAERLQAVEAEIAELTLQLAQAQRDRAVAAAEMGIAGLGGKTLAAARFAVHRPAADGTLETLEARPGDRLRPGDVLEILR